MILKRCGFALTIGLQSVLYTHRTGVSHTERVLETLNPRDFAQHLAQEPPLGRCGADQIVFFNRLDVYHKAPDSGERQYK